MTMTNKPVKEIRMGRIKAAIWENETENGSRLYNVTLSRIYKDPEDDSWKSSESLGRDDLLVGAKILNQAHTWIFQVTKEES
ncbi:MAG: hypothetical protein KC964_18730 [Candidatus Omnitrophica bacterium]|nr:hypothetical protein [Candidatus Omnitrophota bacterium]